MTRARLSEPGHSAARTTAALLGTGPTALAISVALTYALPCPFEWRLAIGVYAFVPVWIALAWTTFVARSGRRAWSGLVVALAAAVLVCLLGRALGRGAP